MIDIKNLSDLLSEEPDVTDVENAVDIPLHGLNSQSDRRKLHPNQLISSSIPIPGLYTHMVYFKYTLLAS